MKGGCGAGRRMWGLPWEGGRGGGGVVELELGCMGCVRLDRGGGGGGDRHCYIHSADVGKTDRQANKTGGRLIQQVTLQLHTRRGRGGEGRVGEGRRGGREERGWDGRGKRGQGSAPAVLL